MGDSDLAGPVYRTHAFLFSGGKIQDLGMLAGNYSAAQGINNAGHIVGYSSITTSSGVHGFLYQHGRVRNLNELQWSLRMRTLAGCHGLVTCGCQEILTALLSVALSHIHLPGSGARRFYPFNPAIRALATMKRCSRKRLERALHADPAT